LLGAAALLLGVLLLVLVLSPAGAAHSAENGRLSPEQPAAPLSDVGVTTRASLNSAGEEANHASLYSDISADGRYVTFVSYADNLVPGDTNGVADVFLRDRQTGQTIRVSAPDRTNGQANGPSGRPAILPDGSAVLFESEASNLVADDDNEVADIFLRRPGTRWTILISRNSNGDPGNKPSRAPDISADGHYVTFQSDADNLVAGDTNGVSDVFVIDLNTGDVTRVSINTNGAAGSGGSTLPRISANGRFVAFRSEAGNLIGNDSNNVSDIFVHDRQTGQTMRVSVNSAGQQANGSSYDPAISDDGRHVAFGSYADNLVSGDSNDAWDIFVHDRETGQTTRVSVNSAGDEANDDTEYATRPVISGDGRYVAFDSDADNLVPGDSDGYTDVFLHDRETAETMLVSANSAGEFGQGLSGDPAISADGRFVIFDSDADNLVSGDGNTWGDVFVRERAGDIDLPDLPPVLSAGGLSTCGLLPSGDALCWGALAGERERTHAGPFVAVDSGWFHACGLTPQGKADCWGNGNLDQAEDRDGPFVQLSTGYYHTCGLRADGSAECWGGPMTGKQPGPFSAISAGDFFSCGIQSDGTVFCWGGDSDGQTHPPDGVFHQISAGVAHACGLQVTGSIVCWGAKGDGQAQNPTGPYRQVVAGRAHTCGLLPNGGAECWGNNDHGQVAQLAGPFTQLSAGDTHNCGLKANGRVTCWGNNDDGQAVDQDGPFGPYVPSQPPQAADQSVIVPFNQARDITLTATDPEGDPLTFTVVSAPQHGLLSGVAPALTYTPAAGYSGPDSFTFKVNDGESDSNVATVSITVAPAAGWRVHLPFVKR